MSDQAIYSSRVSAAYQRLGKCTRSRQFRLCTNSGQEGRISENTQLNPIEIFQIEYDRACMSNRSYTFYFTVISSNTDYSNLLFREVGTQQKEGTGILKVQLVGHSSRPAKQLFWNALRKNQVRKFQSVKPTNEDLLLQ